MSTANGGVQLRAVDPALVFSTDASTIFAFDGTWHKESTTHVAIGSGKVRAHYHNPAKNKKPFNGVRIQGNYTITAAGELSPIFQVVKGLTRWELPETWCPTGVLLVKVPGLCVGADLDSRLRAEGYILFCRRSNKADDDHQQTDQVVAKYYQDNVLLPMIKRIRQLRGWEEGAIVPDEDAAVSWCDGEQSQIGVLTSESLLSVHEENKISDNKHAASASGTQQPGDLAPLFRHLRKIELSTTARTATEVRVKKDLSALLGDLQANGTLILSRIKREAVCDFMACLPSMLAKAATPRDNIAGFESSGLLDDGGVPSFDALLGTCRRRLTTAEVELVRDTFGHLHTQMVDTGYIPDSLFDTLGYPRDCNSKGEEVLRESEYEPRQRAKILSHDKQREIRLALARAAREAIAEKEDTERTKVLALLKDNKRAEQVVLLKGGIEMVGSGFVDTAKGLTIANFSTLTLDLLKAFIRVRTQTGSRGRGALPNKGTSEQAERGVNNLIRMSWMLRCDEVKLEATQPDATTTSSIELLLAPPNQITLTEHNIAFDAHHTAPPATYLDDAAWVKGVDSAIEGRVLPPASGPSVVQTAALLRALVVGRLRSHIQTRVKNPDKHEHWVWDMFRRNATRIAAIAARYSHTKTDLACAHDNTCLLASPLHGAFQNVSSDDSKTQGCYLHYDNVNTRWIRSGKVVDRDGNKGYTARNSEHGKCALLQHADDRNSRFYRSYPSKRSTNHPDFARHGYWEYLLQYAGLGFKRTDPDTSALLGRTKAGLFEFSEAEVAHISAVNFPGQLTLEQKILHVLGYMFELFYDLCLSPQDNVSMNPGCEIMLGIW